MGRPERLHSIEALRGLAALSVTWLHLTSSYPAGPVQASGHYGGLGVDCFFVISGFVIPYSLRVGGYTTRDFGRFVCRRLIRLEPPYLASIVLVLVLGVISTHMPGFRGVPPDYTALQLASHLLYLIPLTPYSWVNPVYWSLAYEFAFYLVTGLLFSALWKRHLILTAAVGFAVFVASRLLVGAWDVRLVTFLFGISACRFKLQRDGVMTFLVCIAVTAVAIVLAGAALSALAALVTALVIAFIRVPDWGALRWLGSISYSLYLIHGPVGGRVVNFGRHYIHGEAAQLALSLCAVSVSLLAAWAFYGLFEVVSTNLSKRVALTRLLTSSAP